MPGRVIATLPGYQFLDSLAVEAGGKVCVATIFNGGITAFDPDGSTEHFAFPDIVTTNICFGGADMRDAWVTCSSTGSLFKCRWPRPGLKLNYNAGSAGAHGGYAVRRGRPSSRSRPPTAVTRQFRGVAASRRMSGSTRSR
jgi:hypothetical protein